MKQSLIAITAAAALAAAPAFAQDEDQGFSLMEEGAQLFLRGLVQELDPALRELEGMADEFEEIAGELQPAFRALAEQMGPAFAELLTDIEDLRHYEAPEFLENGDIIIRRSPDAPPFEPREPASPEDENEDEAEELEL